MHNREFRELICAMLLGDGCLSYGKSSSIGRRGNKKPHDVRYCMNHGQGQIDYALWKANLIDEIFKKKNIARKCTYQASKKHDKNRNKTYTGIYVRFSWTDYLRPLRKKCYFQLREKEHLKNVEYLLKNIHSDLHLAIWLMDDGTEKRKKRKSVTGAFLGFDNPKYDLFTFSFTEGQHNLMKQWFESNYAISPKILKSEIKPPDKCRYLSFSVEDTKKLFDICHPYFSQIESMKSKFRLSFAKYKPEILETTNLVEGIVQTTTSK